MEQVFYKCGRGEIYDMQGARLTVSSGGVHSYSWEPVAISRRFGENLREFDKKAVTYSLTFTIRGSREERKDMINRMISTFDRDVSLLLPGRIYYNAAYIEGYVTKLEVKNNKLSFFSDCEVDVYCPYPFWTIEETRSFMIADTGEETNFLDYPHPYPYDYAPPQRLQHWYIDHYRSSHFKMVIYGTAVNPKIMIGGQPYQIIDTLQSNDHIVIDSRAQTVTKYVNGGDIENAFYKQAPGRSIFEMIPSGDLTISWDGSFGFDITIFAERSVPAYAVTMD